MTPDLQAYCFILSYSEINSWGLALYFSLFSCQNNPISPQEQVDVLGLLRRSQIHKNTE